MCYFANDYSDLSEKLKETSVQWFKHKYKDELKKSIYSFTDESLLAGEKELLLIAI